jgi:hypothetical protein
MLVQPQQAATVCELDLVRHAISHGNGLRPWIRANGRRTAHEPLNLILDFKHAHVNGHFGCTCYHPLFVFNQLGDVERCALRSGNVHSADG